MSNIDINMTGFSLDYGGKATLLRFTVEVVSHYCPFDVRGSTFAGKASVMQIPGIFTIKLLSILLLKALSNH